MLITFVKMLNTLLILHLSFTVLLHVVLSCLCIDETFVYIMHWYQWKVEKVSMLLKKVRVGGSLSVKDKRQALCTAAGHQDNNKQGLKCLKLENGDSKDDGGTEATNHDYRHSGESGELFIEIIVSSQLILILCTGKYQLVSIF